MPRFDDSDIYKSEFEESDYHSDLEIYPDTGQCPNCKKPITEQMDSCPYCGDGLFRYDCSGIEDDIGNGRWGRDHTDSGRYVGSGSRGRRDVDGGGQYIDDDGGWIVIGYGYGNGSGC